MIVIYLISGIHASFFMGKHINTRWSDNRFLNSFDSEAYTRFRRSMHHTLYWFGLLVGLGGLGWAIWGERIMKLLRFACDCGLPLV